MLFISLDVAQLFPCVSLCLSVWLWVYIYCICLYSIVYTVHTVWLFVCLMCTCLKVCIREKNIREMESWLPLSVMCGCFKIYLSKMISWSSQLYLLTLHFTPCTAAFAFTFCVKRKAASRSPQITWLYLSEVMPVLPTALWLTGATRLTLTTLTGTLTCCSHSATCTRAVTELQAPTHAHKCTCVTEHKLPTHAVTYTLITRLPPYTDIHTLKHMLIRFPTPTGVQVPVSPPSHRLAFPPLLQIPH